MIFFPYLVFNWKQNKTEKNRDHIVFSFLNITYFFFFVFVTYPSKTFYHHHFAYVETIIHISIFNILRKYYYYFGFDMIHFSMMMIHCFGFWVLLIFTHLNEIKFLLRLNQITTKYLITYRSFFLILSFFSFNIDLILFFVFFSAVNWMEKNASELGWSYRCAVC